MTPYPVALPPMHDLSSQMTQPVAKPLSLHGIELSLGVERVFFRSAEKDVGFYYLDT